MDHKKTIALAIGMGAIVILFVVVYAQFSAKNALAPSNPMTQQKTVMNGEGDKTMPKPVANPETIEDVTAAIDAQLSEEAAAFDTEVAAETAAIDKELTSLNELNDAYDENAY